MEPESLARHRDLQGRIGRAQLAQVGGELKGVAQTNLAGQVSVNPQIGGMLRGMVENPRATAQAIQIQQVKDMGAELPPIVERFMPKLPAQKPVDNSIFRGVVEHELGEKALIHGAKQTGPLQVKGRWVASHLGALPHLEEQHAVHRDPEAQQLFHKMRGMNPDDQFIRDKMRQYGSTPANPLPIGGRAHAKLEEAVARRTPEVGAAKVQRVMAPLTGGIEMHGPQLKPNLWTRLVGKALPYAEQHYPEHADVFGKVREGLGRLTAPVSVEANLGHKILVNRAIARATKAVV